MLFKALEREPELFDKVKLLSESKLAIAGMRDFYFFFTSVRTITPSLLFCN
jgi:hypothetical protein